MRRHRFALAFVFFTAAVPFRAPAQQPAQQGNTAAPAQEQPYRLNVRANIVAVAALVRDAQGNLVRNLAAGDFRLYEDGGLYPLRYFNADNDLPLRLGVMVDTSGSLRSYFGDERAAAATLFRNTLTRPEDHAFLARFDQSLILLQGMTAHHEELTRALDLLGAHSPAPISPGRGTLLWDALASTLRQLIRNEPGRRAIILLTDGEDQGSRLTVREASQLAQAYDVAIYTLLFPSSEPGYAKEYGHTGRELMQQLADASGGQLFPVRGGRDIAAAFAQIEADLRSEYRLGYVPPESPPYSYHELRLEPRNPALHVRARQGYYTPLPKAGPASHGTTEETRPTPDKQE